MEDADFNTVVKNAETNGTIYVESSSKTVSILSSEDEMQGNGIDPSFAANDLLENGILIETNMGLACVSLKDALTTGVGGLKLSVEDFQNVAAQLLTQQILVDNECGNNLPVINSLSNVRINLISEETQEKTVPVTVNNSLLKQDFQKQLPQSVDTKGTKKNIGNIPVKKRLTKNDMVSFVATSSILHSAAAAAGAVEHTQVKKRGGWPKGRKRKPELAETRPPKAPVTGYVLYLNERRKYYKELPFPEVTKLLGNEWSKLSLDEKQKYLDRAEVDRKRYKEELKVYRQSDAYQAYLVRKRLKNLQGNGTEESDMDATDEIDDEDNEELYCRTCDQWFVSLHNKREHLYGRQHLQSIAGDFQKQSLADQDGHSSGFQSMSTSLDESSLDGPPGFCSLSTRNKDDFRCEPSNVSDAVTHLLTAYSEREEEVKILNKRLEEMRAKNIQLTKQLLELKSRESLLQNSLDNAKDLTHALNQKICSLRVLPSLMNIALDFEIAS